MNEEKYNIYLKGRCIYNSLEKDEFNNTWNMIQNFLSITESSVNKEDLSYKKIAN
jgi:hypothetical protein